MAQLRGTPESLRKFGEVFRGKVWPGSIVEEPAIIQWEVRKVGDFFIWLKSGHSGGRALPSELVIRELLRLDTTNEIAVERFLNSYGWIDGYRKERDPKKFDRMFGQQIAPDTNRDVGSPLFTYYMGLTESGDEEFRILPISSSARFLLEAQECAKYLASDPALPSALKTDLEVRAVMNSRLEHFHVKIELDGDDEDRTADLIDGLYIQLVNLLVDRGGLHRCPNCDTAFVRQRGRARHGQFRAEGVMYCSTSCSNTASTRAYRARQREGKRG